VGQDDRPADHLVGLLGVDAQAEGEAHGLVELRVMALLQAGDRVLERELGLVLELPRLQVLFASFSH
jgi:hypothetical protein